mmetsp:Transcript_11730/g.21330  ORF Transcript_11730/g.21330 Transcript_11730/m.21330 type:complete len:323 (+) Transcript_11730:46-1014(+)
MSTVAPPLPAFLPTEPIVRQNLQFGTPSSVPLSPRGRYGYLGADYRAVAGGLKPSASATMLLQQPLVLPAAPQVATVPWPPPPLPPCELSFRIDSLEARTSDRGSTYELSVQVEQLRGDLETVERARIKDRSEYDKLRAKHLELIAERDHRIRLLEDQLADYRVNVSSVEDLKRQLMSVEQRNLQLSSDFEHLKKSKNNFEKECGDLRHALEEERRKAALLQQEVDGLKVTRVTAPAPAPPYQTTYVQERVSRIGMDVRGGPSGKFDVDITGADGGDHYAADVIDVDGAGEAYSIYGEPAQYGLAREEIGGAYTTGMQYGRE